MSGDCLIGARRIEPHQGNGPGPEHWEWSDGSPWEFTNWAPGEPNNAGNQEDRVQMYRHGTWNDLGRGHRTVGVYKKGGSALDALVLSDEPSSMELVKLLAANSPEIVVAASIVTASTPKTATNALKLLEENPNITLDPEVAEPLLAKDCARLRALIGDTNTLSLTVEGAVTGDGVYVMDGMFNGKARYVSVDDPKQEILWIQIGGTAWHITTNRQQPEHGAWTYQSNGIHPALHGWETDHGKFMPKVTAGGFQGSGDLIELRIDHAVTWAEARAQADKEGAGLPTCDDLRRAGVTAGDGVDLWMPVQRPDKQEGDFCQIGNHGGRPGERYFSHIDAFGMPGWYTNTDPAGWRPGPNSSACKGIFYARAAPNVKAGVIKLKLSSHPGMAIVCQERLDVFGGYGKFLSLGPVSDPNVLEVELTGAKIFKADEKNLAFHIAGGDPGPLFEGNCVLVGSWNHPEFRSLIQHTLLALPRVSVHKV